MAAAADDLAQPAGAAPPVAQVLTPLLSAVAAESWSARDAAAHADVAGEPCGTVSRRNPVQLPDYRNRCRVRIDAVEAFNNGLSRLAMRTGGASVQVSDRRQLPMVLGAMDTLMAGTLPTTSSSFDWWGRRTRPSFSRRQPHRLPEVISQPTFPCGQR
ncbi:MAG: hypothetical protein R3E84_24130 [Pseudomonadales bacterium]